MDKLGETNKRKPTYVACSVFSLLCLVGAVTKPLQKVEIYKQPSTDVFGRKFNEVFLVSESDIDSQWGLDKKKAIKVAQIHKDSKIEKLILISLSLGFGVVATLLADEVIAKEEVLREVKELKYEGQKELLLDRLKFKLAMAGKEQKEMLRRELKALAELLADTDDNSHVHDAIAEEKLDDKLVDVGYMINEGHSLESAVQKAFGHEPGTPEHDRMVEKYKAWESEGEA